MAWQLFFVRDTPVTMWVSMILLLGALVAFAITLLSLYRCVQDASAAPECLESLHPVPLIVLQVLCFPKTGPAQHSLSSRKACAAAASTHSMISSSNIPLWYPCRFVGHAVSERLPLKTDGS